MEHRGLVEYFQVGGASMYLILLLLVFFGIGGVVGLVLASARRTARGGLMLGALAAAGGAAVVGVGVLASSWSRDRVIEAVAAVSPANREMILKVGMDEAAVPQQFGITGGVSLMLLGGAGATLGALRRPAAVSAPRP
jgi:hypothetical protein